MIFHELATNAAKYGALSAATGRVMVGWTVADGVLSITWRESDGPTVTAPTRKGFGSTLIERLAGSELNGKAKVAFDPGGVICMIETPVRAET
jgi:two-component sensor histidine kinase